MNTEKSITLQLTPADYGNLLLLLNQVKREALANSAACAVEGRTEESRHAIARHNLCYDLLKTL